MESALNVLSSNLEATSLSHSLSSGVNVPLNRIACGVFSSQPSLSLSFRDERSSTIQVSIWVTIWDNDLLTNVLKVKITRSRSCQTIITNRSVRSFYSGVDQIQLDHPVSPGGVWFNDLPTIPCLVRGNKTRKYISDQGMSERGLKSSTLGIGTCNR